MWSLLEKTIEYFLGKKISLNAYMTILNRYEDEHKHLINLLFAIMKQYIYSVKCFEKLPKYTEFMEKVSFWHITEKQSLQQNYSLMKLKNFNKKWSYIF